MLGGLSGVLGNVQSDPVLGPAVTAGQNPTAQIASAEQQVAQLDSNGLNELQQGLSQDPQWQQIPAQLSLAAQAFDTAAAAKARQVAPSPSARLAPSRLVPSQVVPLNGATASLVGTYTGDCASAGSAPDEFTATLVANQVQSAAQAAMLAVPGVVAIFFVDVPTGVKIALAVVWGVANAVYLALAQTLGVSTDCAQTAFQNALNATLPVDPADATKNVPGSSEISILNLISVSGDTKTEITNVQNTVNAIHDTQLPVLATAAANLNATLNDTLTRAKEVQGDLQLLQTNTNVLINTETTILGKADQEIRNLSTLQALELRMEIEANLSRNGAGTGMIGDFELPQSSGGYLETVASIVQDTIAKQTATGHGSQNAAGDLASATSAYNARQWKKAYSFYGKAYQDVTK